MFKERRLNHVVKKADKEKFLPKVRERDRRSMRLRLETIALHLIRVGALGTIFVSPAMAVAENFASNSFDDDRQAFYATYPQLSPDVMANVAEYRVLQAQSHQAHPEYVPDSISSLEGFGVDLDEAREKVDTFLENSDLARRLQELKKSDNEFVIWRSDRDAAATKAVGESKSDNFAKIGFLFPGALFAGMSLGMVGDFRKRPKGANLKTLTDFIKIEKPEWQNTPPTSQEVADFVNKATMLPPTGSKLVLLKKDNKHNVNLLAPSQTSDRMSKKVHARAKAIVEGLDVENVGMVHQMTVQGRLPDEFKYAAVSLLMISPFNANWKEGVFYHSPWGKTGPLIHDGGNVDYSVNSRWGDVGGRTDFLYRLYVPGSGKAEEDRLFEEMRFFQRAAFALHCKSGTAPGSVSGEIRAQAGVEWDEYKIKMHGLLGEYGLEGVVGVPWFLDNAREVNDWPGRRHEADWPDIQEKLIEFEDARAENPDLSQRVRQIMVNLSTRIDEIIESS